MKRFGLAIFFIAWSGVALAQFFPFPGPGRSGSGGAAYVGPGDIATFTLWGGVRAYSAATAGTKAIELCDSAGANCADVSTNASTGALNAPGTRGADNCNVVSTCKVRTVYDKVGTNNFVQATAGTMPTLTVNALNSAYGITFSGSNEMPGSANLAATGQPASVSIVAKRTGNTTAFNAVFSADGSGNIQVGFSNAANNALIYAGTVVSVTGVNDNAFHAINTALAGASTIYNIDSATGTVSAGVNGPIGSSLPLLGSAFALSNPFAGVFMEAGFIATTGISAGVASSLNTNQHAAYGGW